MAKTTSWDDASNEASNSFVSWGQEGDFIYGTLVARKKVESTLPDRKGEMQNVYEIKVADCSYHLLDDKKNVIEEAVVPNKGDIVSVGGRSTIDSRMARVKLGQLVGLKFTEEMPAKTKGYNPTKLIKVFTPRDESGEFLVDQEWLDENKADSDF